MRFETIPDDEWTALGSSISLIGIQPSREAQLYLGTSAPATDASGFRVGKDAMTIIPDIDVFGGGAWVRFGYKGGNITYVLDQNAVYATISQAGGETSALLASLFDPSEANATVTATIVEATAKYAPFNSRSIYDVSGFNASGVLTAGGTVEALGKLIFITDHGDATAPDYQFIDNVPDKGSNIELGHIAAHTYRTPGTYTRRTWVLEPGTSNYAYMEHTVTVSAPEDTFGVTDRCFVTNSGATPPADVDPSRVYTSIEAMWAARSASANTWVRVHAGDTWTDVGSTTMILPDHFLLQSDDPSAARPSLTVADTDHNVGNDVFVFRLTSGVADTNTAGRVTFADLEIHGGWDSATETGTPQVICFGERSGESTKEHITFDNLDLQDAAAGIKLVQEDDVAHVSVNDSRILGMRDVGFFGGGYAASIDLLGTYIAHRNTASVGGPKLYGQDAQGNPTGQWYNNHGPIRLNARTELTEYVNISSCDLMSRCGWSEAASLPSPQPCIRAAQGGSTNSRYSIDNCTLEGGFSQISIAKQSTSNPEPTGTFVSTSCRFIAGNRTRFIIDAATAGLYLHSPVIWITDTVPQHATFNFRYLVSAPATDPYNRNIADVGANELFISHATMIHNRTIANRVFTSSYDMSQDTFDPLDPVGSQEATFLQLVDTYSTIYPNITVQDCLYWSPEPSQDYWADFGSVTETLITPRDTLGYFSLFRGFTLDTSQANPVDTCKNPTLPVGSTAIGAGTTGHVVNALGEPVSGSGNVGAV